MRVFGPIKSASTRPFRLKGRLNFLYSLYSSYTPAHVHFELFGTKDMAARKDTGNVDAGPMRKVSIISDRKKIELEVPSAGASILGALILA